MDERSEHTRLDDGGAETAGVQGMSIPGAHARQHMHLGGRGDACPVSQSLDDRDLSHMRGHRHPHRQPQPRPTFGSSDDVASHLFGSPREEMGFMNQRQGAAHADPAPPAPDPGAEGGARSFAASNGQGQPRCGSRGLAQSTCACCAWFALGCMHTWHLA